MKLSFGEQLKIIMNRKNISIQDLANIYEAKTGIKMTRQNLSQRLRRDNFQEQDMYTLAALLDCQVSIQLIPREESPFPYAVPLFSSAPASDLPKQEEVPQAKSPQMQDVATADGSILKVPNLLAKPKIVGDINPLTGEEYLTNTVRPHPQMNQYLQVYDRFTHKWSDVKEDYFWEFQTKKKELLGSDYQAPIII